MTPHLARPPTDPDAFLRWNEGREGRRELIDGSVIEMMTGATYGHMRRVRRIARLLEDVLDSSLYEVGTHDIGVQTSRGVRYPDVLVDRAGSASEALKASGPVLIVEVLSPSSVSNDTKTKAEEYALLASLQAYLVVDQREPQLWLWQRADGGWTGPMRIAAGDEFVVTSLGLRLAAETLFPDLERN